MRWESDGRIGSHSYLRVSERLVWFLVCANQHVAVMCFGSTLSMEYGVIFFKGDSFFP